MKPYKQPNSRTDRVLLAMVHIKINERRGKGSQKGTEEKGGEKKKKGSRDRTEGEEEMETIEFLVREWKDKMGRQETENVCERVVYKWKPERRSPRLIKTRWNIFVLNYEVTKATFSPPTFR